MLLAHLHNIQFLIFLSVGLLKTDIAQKREKQKFQKIKKDL